VRYFRIPNEDRQDKGQAELTYTSYRAHAVILVNMISYVHIASVRLILLCSDTNPLLKISVYPSFVRHMVRTISPMIPAIRYGLIAASSIKFAGNELAHNAAAGFIVDYPYLTHLRH
jgi:hypothetical protein